jgi:Tfp pilus assembly protein FimT
MITIAIFAIIGAIAIPNAISWRDNSKFNGGVFTLVSDLKIAKQSAVRRNENVVINFAGNGYTIFVDNGDGTADADADGVVDGFRNGVQDGDEIIVKAEMFPSGTTISAITFPGNITQFNGRGLCPSANVGRIELVDGKNQRSIEINRLGHISVN